MVSRRALLTGGAGVVGVGFLTRFWSKDHDPTAYGAIPDGDFEVALSEQEWRKRLDPDQFAVLRKEATERPYTSPLNDEHRAGTFSCAGCERQLFSSATKFDSGTGWPSFYDHLEGAIGTRRDGSLMMARTEVHCSRCGGHLGHVFEDGPKPTGLRYCMNGDALTFAPAAT